MTSTYRRQLLDAISTDEIRDTIQDSRATVHTMRNNWSPEMSLALDARLELRYAFLRAIELSELRSNPEPLKTPWLQMKAILENIKKTHTLGVPVPACFSTKLQRQLASTMPPRPIVQLSFEDATARWHRLFEDGMEANDVLKYTDPQTLLVRPQTLLGSFKDRRLTVCRIELCPPVPGQAAPTAGVYPYPSPRLHSEGRYPPGIPNHPAGHG